MKTLPLMITCAIGLTLAACGDSADKGAAAPSGDPVAAVPAPAGTSWSQTVNPSPEGYFVMGNPDAKIKVVEFASYTCSHCRDFAAEGDAELKKLVDTGKVSFELRNYVRDPLDISAALLARCAGKDVFYPLSEQFFANQNAMFERAQAMGETAYQAAMQAPPAQRFVQLAGAVGLIDFAKQRGIAEDQARQCLSDTAAAQKLAEGVEKANATYQISGTPSFLINGSLVDNTATWPALRAKLTEAGA